MNLEWARRAAWAVTVTVAGRGVARRARAGRAAKVHTVPVNLKYNLNEKKEELHTRDGTHESRLRARRRRRARRRNRGAGRRVGRERSNGSTLATLDETLPGWWGCADSGLQCRVALCRVACEI